MSSLNKRHDLLKLEVVHDDGRHSCRDVYKAIITGDVVDCYKVSSPKEDVVTWEWAALKACKQLYTRGAHNS